MLLLTQLTDENHLLVHDNDAIEIGDETALFYNDVIHDILSQPPTGKAINFDRLAIKCTCGGCDNVLLVYDDGDVAIESVNDGWSYTAKIDPRYCSRIYEATCTN